MKSLSLLLALMLSTFIGLAQGKLLVTDFALFNNLNSTDPNFPNFFIEKPAGLESIKSQLTSILKDRYDLTESLFAEERIVFFDNKSQRNAEKSYKENHKTLVKKGGYDYYLLVTSSVLSSNQADEYSFKIQIKLSNERGKKIYSNTNEIPFTALFKNDEIATSDLMTSKDFFKLYGMLISNCFDNKKKKVETKVFYRPVDTQFNDFIANAEKYHLTGYLNQNQVLKDVNGNEITIRVLDGEEFDINIISIGEGELIKTEQVETPVITSVQNSMTDAKWVSQIHRKTDSGFEDLDLAPSADIFLSIGDQKANYFRLINGRLVGDLNSKNYMITLDPSASLLRIFVDQKLIALSQPTEEGNGQNLKIFYEGPKEDVAEVINLHQTYFHSISNLKQMGN